jgi:hypothetical protein
MKKLAVFLFSIIRVSCTQNFVYMQIFGCWTIDNVVYTTTTIVTDKFTFSENDSIIVEIFSDGQLLNQMKGKYELNTTTRILKTDYEQGTFTFKVIKLTKDAFELENPTNKTIAKYIRY